MILRNLNIDDLKRTVDGLQSEEELSKELKKDHVRCSNLPTSLWFTKLYPEAGSPIKSSIGSAGYDLFSTADVEMVPLKQNIIPTGIAMEIPEGWYGRIAARSGLALQYGMTVLGGVIDSDYRGEIKIIAFTLVPMKIVQGQRIAQIVIESCANFRVLESTLSPTERGSGGFGSSGSF